MTLGSRCDTRPINVYFVSHHCHATMPMLPTCHHRHHHHHQQYGFVASLPSHHCYHHSTTTTTTIATIMSVPPHFQCGRLLCVGSRDSIRRCVSIPTGSPSFLPLLLVPLPPHHLPPSHPSYLPSYFLFLTPGLSSHVVGTSILTPCVCQCCRAGEGESSTSGRNNSRQSHTKSSVDPERASSWHCVCQRSHATRVSYSMR